MRLQDSRRWQRRRHRVGRQGRQTGFELLHDQLEPRDPVVVALGAAATLHPPQPRDFQLEHLDHQPRALRRHAKALDLRQSPVDDQFDAGNVRRVVARKKQCRLRKLGSFAETLERYLLCELRGDL